MHALRPVLLVFLLLPVSAEASDLYKCTDAKGEVSIQSRPCAPGWTQQWKRDARPEALPTPGQLADAAARRERDAEAARQLAKAAGNDAAVEAPAPTPPEPVTEAEVEAQAQAQAKGPCRRAHELATQIRALELLELRSDQVYRLDEWVAKQCEEARKLQ